MDDRREGRARGARCGPGRTREAVQGGREASGEGPGAAALGPPWAAARRVQTGPRRSKLGRLAPGAAAKADAGRWKMFGLAGAAPRAPRSRAGGALPRRLGQAACAVFSSCGEIPGSPGPRGRETRASSPTCRLGAPQPWRAMEIPE